jgi:hypothetical protein
VLVRENNGLRLVLELSSQNDFHCLTEVQRGDGTWQRFSDVPNFPVEALKPTGISDGHLIGSLPEGRWKSTFETQSDGFRITTLLTLDRSIDLKLSMILWIGALDNMNDRQAHTWRQTILRAPTVNQQGLPGNDLPARYFYDHATHTETICYFPPDSFRWAQHRFYHFTMREVMSYQPTARYGVGLVPNPTDPLTHLEPGQHRFVWWFIQRHREEVPTQWEAQRTLVDTISSLLDSQPAIISTALPWNDMAQYVVVDLHNEACWVEVDGQKGLRAYVSGTSAERRDKARGFELMTQLDVLWPLLLWREATGNSHADQTIDRLRATLPLFYRPDWNYVVNHFPPGAGDSFMDTWYFLENSLIKLPWAAYLTQDSHLREMFFTAIAGAATLVHNTNYLFPLFADADGWRSKNSLLNVSVGGLYAAGCILAYQMDEHQTRYLDEAALALRTIHQLPIYQLTHEPQQLTFAAAAASYLALVGHQPETNWLSIADDFVRLAFSKGYWGKDPTVPFYDPRGMFQACASLCYPAFKENVEVLIPWPELISSGLELKSLMAAFANLQRCHNYAFFDPYLPESLRRGPCAYIPYEDLATAEFTHSAKLGKELYGVGEVFWSALMFDALGRVGDSGVLCLSLDVPCLELRSIPPAAKRRFLLYNPYPETRTTILWNGAEEQSVVILPEATFIIDPT